MFGSTLRCQVSLNDDSQESLGSLEKYPTKKGKYICVEDTFIVMFYSVSKFMW